MNSSVTGHPWSEESLFHKAQLYVERMEAYPGDDWQFGLWSALTLELLARAALSHISPTLQADNADWRNLAYALGNDLTSRRFFPKSVSSTDMLSRLRELVPTFDDEIFGFCNVHIRRRNAELHSGELAFEELGTSEWLPRFYLACNVLLKSMDKELENFISNAADARDLINAFKDAAASSVMGDIKAYKKVWSDKDDSGQDEARKQAATWAIRQEGHRVTCPACNSQALVHGTRSGPVVTNVDGDEVTQTQTMLPSAFECIACGLRISSLSKLTAAGLGNAFSATYSYMAAEFFELYTEEELEEARNEMPEFEPDFNE